MVTYKQELPPPGGFEKIPWAKRPVKGRFSPAALIGGFVAFHGLGWLAYMRFRANKKAHNVEMTDARHAVAPFQLAERDRAFLIQLRKNRDEENELMKDVPGWETGTLYGKPVFHNLRDRWTRPVREEIFAHMSPKAQHELYYDVMKHN